MNIKHASMVLLLGVVAFGTSGCCKDLGKKAAEKAAEKAIENQADGSVKVKLGSGANLAGLSPKFRYPGAKPLMKMDQDTAGRKATVYSMKTSDSMTKVRAFYDAITSPKRAVRTVMSQSTLYVFGTSASHPSFGVTLSQMGTETGITVVQYDK